MGAGADRQGRPVSHPRSSNRTCGFPASGFPTGFIADSRTGVTQRTSEPQYPQLSEDPSHRKLSRALRGHLVPPSQEMPYTLLHTFVDRPVSLRRASQSEVRFPAPQSLIQPDAHLLPRSYMLRLQQVSHFLFDPVHALLRRTPSDVLSPRPRTVVRLECIAQKIESLPPGIPEARLLFLQCQFWPPQHPTRPLQCLRRFSTTEDHEVIRVIHYARPKLPRPTGLPPSLQHPVHIQVCEQRTD